MLCFELPYYKPWVLCTGECAMHRFVFTARVPSVRGLCELLPPVIPFGQANAE